MIRILVYFSLAMTLQVSAQNYPYAPSRENPFGLPNPAAPKQLLDFEEMIGTCKCKSVTRVDQSTWADTVDMTWTFKYIMNGMAIQDETYKADGLHAGSIRQFNVDSSRWYVHYYAVAGKATTLPAWDGRREADKIILYRDQPAPNGIAGYYRITFYGMNDRGYDWIGEWVDKQETFTYPTWRIFCRRP